MAAVMISSLTLCVGIAIACAVLSFHLDSTSWADISDFNSVTAAGLTWIVERSFAWLGRNRRFSKDYEYRVQTSETMLDIAATRLMLNRLAPA